jgi:hypothetical protein
MIILTAMYQQFLVSTTVSRVLNADVCTAFLTGKQLRSHAHAHKIMRCSCLRITYQVPFLDQEYTIKGGVKVAARLSIHFDFSK